MLKSNIIGLFIILLIVYMCYNNHYEKFSNYMIISENQNPTCSMNCCKYTWPIDHIDQTNIFKKYNSSNIMCDNGHDVGCMCIEKSDVDSEEDTVEEEGIDVEENDIEDGESTI